MRESGTDFSLSIVSESLGLSRCRADGTILRLLKTRLTFFEFIDGETDEYCKKGHCFVGSRAFIPRGDFLLVAAQVTPSAQKPVIVSVESNFETNQITLVGQRFGNAEPAVTLDGTALTVISYTPTNVVAGLPVNLQPGSYQLSLKNHSDGLAGAFPLTLGAVGERGAGAAGSSGSRRPPGPARSSRAAGISAGVSFAPFYINEIGVGGIPP